MKAIGMAGDPLRLGEPLGFMKSGSRLGEYAQDSGWSQRTREVLSLKLKYLSPNFRWAGSKALQIQCESGLMADGLVRRGCEVTAVDTRSYMVDLARSRSRASGYRVWYDHAPSLSNLPFEDGSFDVVLCDHVFERGGDLTEILQECARLLRPGGVLLYSSTNATLRSRIFSVLAPTLLMPGLPRSFGLRRLMGPRKLSRNLRRAGFRNERVAGLRLRLCSLFDKPAYRLTSSRPTIYIGLAERL